MDLTAQSSSAGLMDVYMSASFGHHRIELLGGYVDIGLRSVLISLDLGDPSVNFTRLFGFTLEENIQGGQGRPLKVQKVKLVMPESVEQQSHHDVILEGEASNQNISLIFKTSEPQEIIQGVVRDLGVCRVDAGKNPSLMIATAKIAPRDLVLLDTEGVLADLASKSKSAVLRGLVRNAIYDRLTKDQPLFRREILLAA